jgi:hypothetical protein
VKGAAGVAAIIVAVVILGGGHAATQTDAYACATTQTTPAPAHHDGTYTLRQLSALWVSQGGPTTDINGDGYPEHVEAAAIAMAESGGDPNAGPNHPYHGLWQIGPGGPFDPVENARAAVAKFLASQASQGDGWLPWTTYTGYDTGPGGTHGPRTFLKFLHDTGTGTAPATLIDPGCAAAVGIGGTPGTATAADIAANPQIILQPAVTLDRIDPRLLGLLQWISSRHEIVVTALRNGTHAPNSNHYSGRAVDIGMVDKRLCVGYVASDSCGQLAIEVARLPVAQRPTEILACFDADGPGPALARADHCDHEHFGPPPDRGPRHSPPIR